MQPIPSDLMIRAQVPGIESDSLQVSTGLPGLELLMQPNSKWDVMTYWHWNRTPQTVGSLVGAQKIRVWKRNAMTVAVAGYEVNEGDKLGQRVRSNGGNALKLRIKQPNRRILKWFDQAIRVFLSVRLSLRANFFIFQP
jgi:hypothetical protein